MIFDDMATQTDCLTRMRAWVMARRGAQALARTQLVEFQAMAQEMAAAAIGLRGVEAHDAMMRARERFRERRWAAITKAADAKLQRIILRDHAEFERRLATVFESSKVK